MGGIRYMNVWHHGCSARAPFPGLRASYGRVDDSTSWGAEEIRAGACELREFLGFQGRQQPEGSRVGLGGSGLLDSALLRIYP